MATLLKANGEASPIEPKNGKDFGLEELYSHLDTDMVQVVPCDDGRLMIIDEEGKLKKGARLNPAATELCKGYLAPTDFIVRDAIVCLPEQFK